MHRLTTCFTAAIVYTLTAAIVYTAGPALVCAPDDGRASGSHAGRGKTGKLGKALASRGATESRAANMLEHSAKPIHISLTDIDSALHNKEAVSLFKSALAWAGERPDPTPAFHAHTILKAARDTPELRPELYLQMLKQLTNCEVAEAARRYWELLALLLQVAAPGTGCEDFVHAYCYKHAAADTSKRCARADRNVDHCAPLEPPPLAPPPLRPRPLRPRPLRPRPLRARPLRPPNSSALASRVRVSAASSRRSTGVATMRTCSPHCRRLRTSRPSRALSWPSSRTRRRASTPPT